MGMEQRQRRREGSRRAEAARQRRQDSRKRRQNRKVFYLAGGAIGVAILVAVIVLLQNSGPGIGVSVSTLPGGHGPPYDYVQNVTFEGVSVRVPPTSGNHFGDRESPYGFLGGPVEPEAAVHNMEHGAVVIWYQPEDPTLAGQVNQLVRGLGRQCIVAGSYPTMSSLVAVTVWGRVLPLDTFDEGQLLDFIREYRGNEGPEAGICRSLS